MHRTNKLFATAAFLGLALSCAVDVAQTPTEAQTPEAAQCEPRPDRRELRSAYRSLEDEIAAELGGFPLLTPYSGLAVTRPTETQIEHVVALAEMARAPETCTWTLEDWLHAAGGDGLFMDNLTLATGPVNRDKSEKGEAEWLPERNRCWYVRKRNRVYEALGLTRDPADAEVAKHILSTRDCRGL